MLKNVFVYTMKVNGVNLAQTFNFKGNKDLDSQETDDNFHFWVNHRFNHKLTLAGTNTCTLTHTE